MKAIPMILLFPPIAAGLGIVIGFLGWLFSSSDDAIIIAPEGAAIIGFVTGLVFYVTWGLYHLLQKRRAN